MPKELLENYTLNPFSLTQAFKNYFSAFSDNSLFNV
jgi:hypothetical protein